MHQFVLKLNKIDFQPLLPNKFSTKVFKKQIIWVNFKPLRREEVMQNIRWAHYGPKPQQNNKIPAPKNYFIYTLSL